MERDENLGEMGGYSRPHCCARQYLSNNSVVKFPTEAGRRVVRSLLEDGPATAPELAERLALTPPGVRRHLDVLEEEGIVISGERPAFGPAPTRGRGRPPRIYSITEAGRDFFGQAYDDLAVAALRFLAESGGDNAVSGFAEQRAADMERRYLPLLNGAKSLTERVDTLVKALTDDGYAASVTTTPMTAGGPGAVQICQHNCPVAHVAAEFPQLCEAEASMFSRLLDSHVTRLATIAHGDGICTAVVGATPTQREPIRRPVERTPS